jgi:MFS family permease
MEPTTSAVSPKVGILINRNYALLFIGQAISLIGDQIVNLTIALWIATSIARGQPWAPLAVSGAFIAATVPVFLLGPVAGVFADRWHRQRTMLRMDAARAALIALMLVITGIAPLPFLPLGTLPVAVKLGTIYGMLLLVAACSQFFGPSRFALIAEVVPNELRPRSTALAQVSQATAAIIGPPLAAPLLFGFGVGWALIVDACSFMASFVLIALLRLPTQVHRQHKEHGKVSQEFRQGLRLVFGSVTMRALLIALVLTELGSGAYNALYIFFLPENLHTAPGNAGYLTAALGAGVILGAFVSNALNRRIGLVRMVQGSLLVAGICFMAMARLTSFVPVLCLAVCLGIAEAALNVGLMPLVIRETPHHMMGRVSGVFMPLTTSASLIGLALAGYLASTVLVRFHAQVAHVQFGPIDTIFTGAGLLILAGGIYALVALRDAARQAGERAS